MKYFKLCDSDKKCRGLEMVLDVRMKDVNEWNPDMRSVGGLHYCDIDHVVHWINILGYTHVFDVEIPEDAYTAQSNTKYKANVLIVSNHRKITDCLAITDYCKQFVEKEGRNIMLVPHHLQTRDLALRAVFAGADLFHLHKDTVDHVVLKLIIDKEKFNRHYVFNMTQQMADLIVTYLPDYYQDLPVEFRSEELSRKALVDPKMLIHVPITTITKEMIYSVIDRNGWNLGYVPVPLRTKTICDRAVKNNKKAKKFVPRRI